MTSKSKLVQAIISKQNLSGAIKGAPHGLLKLKEAIEGVPFELLQKGMSGIMDQNNMMKGVMGLVKQLGSVQALGGQLSQVLQQAASQAGVSGDLMKIDPSALAQHVNVDQLIAAIGDSNALTAALSNYVGSNNNNTSDSDKLYSAVTGFVGNTLDSDNANS